MTKETLKNAIYQNLNEISDALFYLHALIGMFNAEKENNILFLRLASDALKNDMVSRLIKVLDKTKDAGSFWYILPSCSKNAYVESYKISAKPREINACGDFVK